MLKTSTNLDLYLARLSKKYNLVDIKELHLRVTAYNKNRYWTVIEVIFERNKDLEDLDSFEVDDFSDTCQTICEDLVYFKCPVEGTSLSKANQVEVHIDFDKATLTMEFVELSIKRKIDPDKTLVFNGQDMIEKNDYEE
jgi:hypothetical protein